MKCYYTLPILVGYQGERSISSMIYLTGDISREVACVRLTFELLLPLQIPAPLSKLLHVARVRKQHSFLFPTAQKQQPAALISSLGIIWLIIVFGNKRSKN